MVLDAEFDGPIQFCDDGRLSAYKDKAPLYFKHDGSPLQPPNGHIVNGSCGSSPPYTLRIGDKYGLVDADTAPLTPVHFDAVDWTGPRGSALNVKIDGKWGRIGSMDAGSSSPGLTTYRVASISSLRPSTANAASCGPTDPD